MFIVEFCHVRSWIGFYHTFTITVSSYVWLFHCACKALFLDDTCCLLFLQSFYLMFFKYSWALLERVQSEPLIKVENWSLKG